MPAWRPAHQYSARGGLARRAVHDPGDGTDRRVGMTGELVTSRLDAGEIVNQDVVSTTARTSTATRAATGVRTPGRPAAGSARCRTHPAALACGARSDSPPPPAEQPPRATRPRGDRVRRAAEPAPPADLWSSAWHVMTMHDDTYVPSSSLTSRHSLSNDGAARRRIEIEDRGERCLVQRRTVPLPAWHARTQPFFRAADGLRIVRRGCGCINAMSSGNRVGRRQKPCFVFGLR